MLSLSADLSQNQVDLRVINGAGDGGIEFGAQLSAFAEAVAGGSASELEQAREKSIARRGQRCIGGCSRSRSKFSAHGTHRRLYRHTRRRHDGRTGRRSRANTKFTAFRIGRKYTGFLSVAETATKTTEEVGSANGAPYGSQSRNSMRPLGRAENY